MTADRIPMLAFQHIAPELRLFHGEDSLASLKRELERKGCRRAVLICGQTISRSPVLDLLRSALGETLVGTCAAAKEHSPVSAVEEAARFLEESHADALIAVGGGSAAVTARAAAILLGEKKPAQELCTRREADGRFTSPRLNAPKLPLFVVATTPSTAFPKAGCAIHAADGQRLAMFDPKTRATAMFVHPAFLATAPMRLVQSASLNTLANAVEALESPNCDPVSEALLRHALHLVGANLPQLHLEGTQARERLALAAILCGRGTEQGGAGLASVLAHAIGARTHTSNGIVNAIVLPHTMRFNAPVTLLRGEAVKQALFDATGGDGTAGATSSSDAVERLLARLDVPRRLRDIGVAEVDLRPIADAAMSDWFIGRNARKVPDVHTLLALLEAAW